MFSSRVSWFCGIRGNASLNVTISSTYLSKVLLNFSISGNQRGGIVSLENR